MFSFLIPPRRTASTPAGDKLRQALYLQAFAAFRDEVCEKLRPMIFSFDWISQYLDPGAEAEEVAARLTAAGLAVESSEPCGDDVLFDVDVTTNRPDCMNHLGLAREASTLLGQALHLPDTSTDETDPEIGELAKVIVEDGYGCPRYVARVVRGAKVGPSPRWLVEHLEAIGQRSINNVVDITNFVLWEMGQPIHAFDLAKLAEETIVVRRAREGEYLKTLDEVRSKARSGDPRHSRR